VETKSILIFFSEKVDQTTGATSAKEPTNYQIFAPNSGINPAQSPTGWPISVEKDGRTVAISTPSGVSFAPGDWVVITVQNIGLDSTPGASAMANPETIHRQVPNDAGRTTKDVEDAISYPILTEEVAYRPSPVGIQTSGAGGIAGPGASNLGRVALQAVTDVLGWKANPADPKGFVGALTQAFTLKNVEGHVEATWSPRTYAVQTDLGGGITGAQASLYARAKEAVDQSLTLLDGLYPLDPEADPEYVKALREMARSQMMEIVKELGTVGLPSILRIDTYFKILLGQNPATLSATGDHVQFDPDQIQGTLGDLRDTYAIFFEGNDLNNSVEDEQDITNFRVISDYMTSLMQSWIANRKFFIVKPSEQAFFGTQLVLISRQFNVIAETVNEVRFALDSVFIGPNERQTLLLEFKNPKLLPSMFLEDILHEVEAFVTDEGPRLLRDGGRISVTNNILPVVDTLKAMIDEARTPKNKKELPDGFKTARVRHSFDDLSDQLRRLIELTKQIKQSLPPAEGKPVLHSVSVVQQNGVTTATLLGEQFDSAAEVSIHSGAGIVIKPGDTGYHFRSSQEIDVDFDPTQLLDGTHDVSVTNPNEKSATLQGVFATLGGQIFSALKRNLPPVKNFATRKKYRQVQGDLGGGVVMNLANGSTSTKAQTDLDTLRKQVEVLEKQLASITQQAAAQPMAQAAQPQAQPQPQQP